MKTISSIFCITLMAASAYALSLPQLRFETLFDEADVVVIVRIESGRLVSFNGFPCGAIYKAEVVKSFKGNLAESTMIEFGPFEGYGIGEKFLLLLKRKGSRFNPVTAISGETAAALQEYFEMCKTVEADFNVMFHGHGALEVSSTAKFNYEDAIRFPEKWVLPPEGLEKRLVEPTDNAIPSSEYWVRESSFIEHLKNLRQKTKEE